MSEVSTAAEQGRLAMHSAFVIVAGVAIYFLSVLLLYSGTVYSMVETWIESDSFTHCFFILPISIWLAWRQRRALPFAEAVPSPAIASIVLAGSLVWLAANLVDVFIVSQLAFVLVLVSGISAILGKRLSRPLAFPLAFLFLAVPMGRALIPPMMDFTAEWLEYLLRQSGIPVFRQGTYLSLPKGDWSIVEACSGVRFLVAAFTLGLVYAYLSYTSLWRRAAFMAVAVVLPVVANVLRAYGIVMIGHLTDLEYAAEADHIIYGWVFFSIVMVAMFFLGELFREKRVAVSCPEPLAASEPRHASLRLGRYTVVVALVTACAAVGPFVSWRQASHAGANVSIPEFTLRDVGLSEVADPGWGWQPRQPGSDRRLEVYLEASGETVGLYIHQYLDQRPGAELVQGLQTWRADRRNWRVLAERRIRTGDPFQFDVDEAELQSARYRLLVWSMYHIDGSYTPNPYLAKLLEARQRLVSGHRDGSRVFLATTLDADIETSRARLAEILALTRPSIEQSLGSAFRVPAVGTGEP